MAIDQVKHLFLKKFPARRLFWRVSSNGCFCKSKNKKKFDKYLDWNQDELGESKVTDEELTKSLKRFQEVTVCVEKGILAWSLAS